MEGLDFVEEIDYSELKFIQVVGRGAFGVVSQAKWGDTDVAVKHIETESEKRAFMTELKQLSRVHHPNIVKLYGASTKSPVCLVMEYAEGGSLYNVLHGVEPQPDYTLGHAMSWCLQCALGVEYLHSMKPRPLIHRDLKPPNLLLIANGTILKICDFGTACDAHTHMTNNKGSAAWMAPEVFEGSMYSEKCDVFSWGIIMWEVLTRLKPFDEIGGPAFRIMWAVHNGTRPPKVSNCPEPIQRLMTRCWSANPLERPSITEVVRIMKLLMPYCRGCDLPLVYPSQQTEVSGVSLQSGVVGSIYDTPPPSNRSPGTGSNSTIHALRDTVRQALGPATMGDPVPVPQPTVPKVKPMVVEDESTNWRRTSAPASLAASRENLLDKSSRSSTPNIDLFKRYSADLSKLEEVDFMAVGAALGGTTSKPPVRGHRRTGSHGTPFITPPTNTNLLGPNWTQTPAKGAGHKRTGSYGNTPFKPSDLVEMTHSQTVPTTMGSTQTSQIAANYRNNTSASWSPVSPNVPTQRLPSSMTQEEMLNNMAQIPMDYQLQPLPPCESCPESMEIYEEHLKLAEQFYRVQVEIMVLSKRNAELQKELEEDEQEMLSNTQLVEEYTRLVTENESLDLLKKNLNKAIKNWKQEQEKEPSTHPAHPRRP